MDELQLRKKPKILLTNFSDEEKVILSNKIRGIGGILYESSVRLYNYMRSFHSRR